MAKRKTTTHWMCSDCGNETLTWEGKCSSCGAWNTIKEVKILIEESEEKQSISKSSDAAAKTLLELSSELEISPNSHHYAFQSTHLQKFFGSGITVGSLTLLAGEPGLGKSTLCLQLLRSLIKKNSTLQCLYITAEESSHELARRSKRLGIPNELIIAQANNWSQISTLLTKHSGGVVVVDSIQTVYDHELTAAPGSVTQVSTLTSRLLAFAKSTDTAVILVGHVTKDGNIAGPKTLEHLVDSVLVIDSTESPAYRTLTFTKHRFGSTSELLLLKMGANGLDIITDPALALLETLEHGTGIVYGITMTKNLPSVTEIQALVTVPNSEQFSKGERTSIGIKSARLDTIIALMNKYLGVNLHSFGVFVHITGSTKVADDPSLDLPIMLAIISSYRNQSIDQLLNILSKSKSLFTGRLTLSGTIRAATMLNERTNVATKLGYELNTNIDLGSINNLKKYLQK
jgi:DNA repair protein RadA/Sms